MSSVASLRDRILKVSLINIALFLLLILYATRFENRNCSFLLLFVGVALAASARTKRHFRINMQFIVLGLFGITYYVQYLFVWNIPFDMTTSITLCFGAPLMFLAGQRIMESTKIEDFDKAYLRICLTMSIGMLIWAAASYVSGGVITDYADGADIRAVPDYWTGELWQATNFNGYTIIALILACVLIVYESRLYLKAIFGAIIILCVYLSLVTAARTNLIIIPAVFVAMSIFALFEWIKQRDGYLGNTIQNASIVVIFLLFLFAIILPFFDELLDVLPLDAFSERAVNRNLALSNDGRLFFWTLIISEIPSHPFGGITVIESAHNLVLDVIRVSGLVPAFFLVLFLISSIFTCCRVYLLKETLSSKTRMAAVMLSLLLIASFMIEPVLQAKPFVFIGFCLICGMHKGIELALRGKQDGKSKRIGTSL